MPGDAYSWDFFLAHASQDQELAEALHALLAPHAKTFLDSRSIQPGQEWDDTLDEALRSSRITVFLITSRVAGAHYMKDEIALAISLARADRNRRVVPAFVLEDSTARPPTPYGLNRKHGITVSRQELTRLAQQLLELLTNLKQQHAEATLKKEETVVAQSQALEKLTRGTSKEQLEGLREITRFFGSLRWCLLAIFLISVMGAIWCLLLPPPAIQDTNVLAAGGLGAVATGSFSGLLVIINKSLAIAREIARAGFS